MGILPSFGSFGSFSGFRTMETTKTLETKVSSNYIILYFCFWRIHIDPRDMRTPEVVFQLYPTAGYLATDIKVAKGTHDRRSWSSQAFPIGW
jgi:hypothetical protein